ncbi:MAG TPA: aspartate--tRNA ligase [Nocardioidaceae bacterium]|nr:aspartate--tRNA ligase [Nocardioidaceae bacterium]
MIRTHDAGTLRAENVGQTVTLAGWVARRRDHGGVAFLDLRDASGVVQVVVRDEEVARHLRAEYCLRVTGEVTARPEGNQNAQLPTGEVEVIAAADGGVEVLSAAAPLPFPIDEHVEVGEEVRLAHRYLDLRRAGPGAALRLRSEVNRAAREVLNSQGFVEVETPTLTRSTPEGARDFLVPARLQPGSWYALPQSPQLFKQLLMVAGMERYFQIARCYRDEDFRADRQPEFTQLDIEMSFVEQDDVLALSEDVLKAVWALVGEELTTPFPRMTYAEAMARYGSDKPDLRLDLELTECTEYFQETPFRVFQAPYVGAVVMPGGASQPRKQLDAWQEWAKQRGARGLAYVLVQEDGELGGPVAKNLSEDERSGLAKHVGAKPGDCVFFAAGPVKSSRALLGAARLEIGRRCGLIDEDAWSFLWVVDAPLFEPADEATAAGDVAVGSGQWTAVHHAFTSPQDLATFDEDPGSALAWAYDIVCNGNEIGGGSIRIHREDVQKRVFAVMGIDEAEAQEKFGFLLQAFKYGAPPHGGIAFGWDRICALLAGTDSIRDVIAFPKTGAGYDPLTAAPAPITPEQRKEAGVDARPVTSPDAGPDASPEARREAGTVASTGSAG